MGRHRVVIAGAGYAGVRLARDLSRLDRKSKKLEIFLLNDTAYHRDPTTYYEVATAYLERDSRKSSETISEAVQAPLTDIFNRFVVNISEDGIERINTNDRQVELKTGLNVSYDTLVLALGSDLATFNVPGVGEHTFSIKRLPDALQLRHHVVQQFIRACDMDHMEKKSALTFVVIGGGASGVETAAELAGQAMCQCEKFDLEKDAPRVILLEAGGRVLSSMPEKVSQAAMKRLEKIGVEVRCGSQVSQVEADFVKLKDGEKIMTETAVWTAGLKAHDLLMESRLPVVKWGVDTQNNLQVKGHPDVYAVGDVAMLMDYPYPLPATVPVAYTQASLLAKNIMRKLQGEPLYDYRFKTVGSLITLGGKYAVAELPNGKMIMGVLPWIMKNFVTLRYWSWYLPWHKAWKLWWHGRKVFLGND